MKYFFFVAILFVTNEAWPNFVNDFEGSFSFFASKPKWETLIGPELNYHKGNAIFLRNHVERE